MTPGHRQGRVRPSMADNTTFLSTWLFVPRRPIITLHTAQHPTSFELGARKVTLMLQFRICQTTFIARHIKNICSKVSSTRDIQSPAKWQFQWIAGACWSWENFALGRLKPPPFTAYLSGLVWGKHGGKLQQEDLFQFGYSIFRSGGYAFPKKYESYGIRIASWDPHRFLCID